MDNKKFTLLLVDDDPVDRRVIKRTFKKIGLNLPIIEANDGREALKMLNNPGSHGLPEDISSVFAIVDINMPNLDGISLLKEIKSNPNTKHIIVYILSTSTTKEDVRAAYENFAAGYLVKGPTLESNIEKAEFLEKLTRTVETPR